MKLCSYRLTNIISPYIQTPTLHNLLATCGKLANMDEKTLRMLEFHKVVDKLASYAAFSASIELAHQLTPAKTIDEALARQKRTSEACLLLSINADVSVGGVNDIRPLADVAWRGGVLTEHELLSVSGTLVSSRRLYRSMEKLEGKVPTLLEITRHLQPPAGIIEAISRCISEHAEVLDSASPKLGSIRSEMKVSHDRLKSKLERMIGDPATQSMLQDPIITLRNGRYVIPIRAEFKSKLKSIVHDQSSSGATLFVEPVAVVELNNRWHELQLEERDEVRRILAELSAKVGEEAEQIKTIVNALAEFDLALMCAKYSIDLKASEPILKPIHPPAKSHHPGTTIKLLKARHPLLDQTAVVPIDINLDPETFAVIITGPNTGGKTVSLKTVGLMVVMAQSGLHIPAQSGSELSFFEDIFADIGDEQSIEQSLSTFSGHISNIVRILNGARSKNLVLLDELGAGTDPQEGSAIARAIMLYLIEKRVPCMIATHYPELKALAYSTPGAVNASMEFDIKSLRPTYHLTIGIPGRSNALAIAKRLHLPEEILESARNMLDPNDLKTEDLLKEIHFQREVARKARSAADHDRSIAMNLKQELSEKLSCIEEERQKAIENSRLDAENELTLLRKEIDEIRRSLLKARKPVEELKTIQNRVEQLEQTIKKPPKASVLKNEGSDFVPEVGKKARVRSMDLEGIVTAIGLEDVEVLAGNLRLRVKMTDLGPVKPSLEPINTKTTSARKRRNQPAEGSQHKEVFQAPPSMEIDLRGQRAEDALDMLDRYLDNAIVVGMPFVRIIHGKGTGRLRQVIRDTLRGNSNVSSFEDGGQNEGGDGVTIVHF
jgi:DNA mismatch repair protein MutS2